MTFLSPQRIRGYPPEVSLFAFDLYRVLAEALELLPSPAGLTVRVWIERNDTLAYVRHGGGGADIVLHPLLNHPETPVEVLRHIIIHELLHLWIPPGEVDGKLVMHSPDFWEAEARYVPWVKESWFWMNWTLGSHLERDEERQCTRVKRGWRKSLHHSRPAFDSILGLAEDMSQDDSYRTPVIL